MSDQQTRDRVRRTLDAAARDGIPDNLDLRLDVLRVLAQRHGPSAVQRVRRTGQGADETEDDDETLDDLRTQLSQHPEVLPLPEKWSEQQQSSRRETLKLVAAALVFALVGGLLVITLRGTAERTGAPQATPVSPTIVPTPNVVQPVSATVDVGGRPYGLAASNDGVWVPDIEHDVIVQIDPASNEIVAEVDIGPIDWQDPSGLSCGCSPVFAVTSSDGVWFSRSSGSGESEVFEVAHIDATTSELDQIVALEALPDKLVLASGDLWVTSQYHNAVIRIDAETGTLLATIAIDDPRGMIAATDSAVWVTSLSNNTVSRIDPTTNAIVATISIGSPLAVAVSGETVWVASLNLGALFKIDPTSNDVVARVDVVGPDWLTAADGMLWVHSSSTGEVLRLDPVSGETRARFATGTGVATMAVAEDTLWVALANEGKVLRIDFDE